MNSAQKKINKSRGPVLDDFKDETRTAKVSASHLKPGYLTVAYEPYAKTQTSKDYNASKSTLLHDIQQWVEAGILPKR